MLPPLYRDHSNLSFIYILMAVNLAVYLWIYYIQEVQGLHLACFGGLQPRQIFDAGEYWRIFSSIFVHYNFAHLAFNMTALFIFGAYAKEIFGWKGMLVIYVISGIFANLVALLMVHPVAVENYNYCAIGASGSVLGLTAAAGFFMWHVWRRSRNRHSYIFARHFAVILLLQLAIDFFMPHVSQVHHLSGIFAGVVLACVFVVFPKTFHSLMNNDE